MASHAPHLLLVEDEPAVTHVVRATLDYGGFSNEAVGTAFDALQALDRRAYDAVLLDLGLPDVEGPHLVKLVRSRSDVPIVVLSGQGSEHTKIEALDHGADDFVEKPFLPGELLARLRAVLRRQLRVANDHDADIGDGAADASFTQSELKLLNVLKDRSGEVATVDDIVRSIWSNGAKRDIRHVRVLVSQLRRKLELIREPYTIETERSSGYRLVSLSLED